MPWTIRQSARAGRSRPAWIFVALVLVAGSCGDPQSPVPAASDAFRGSYLPSGTMEFAVETPGTNAMLRLEAAEIHVDAEAHTVSAQVRLRNVGTAPVAGPDGIQLLEFAPAGAQPLNVPSPCAGPLPCPPWIYDHRGTYGEDGMLAPGESSEPVHWLLVNPSGESFTFRARPVSRTSGGDGLVAGRVFQDANGNGVPEPDEPGRPGVTIRLAHGDATSEQQSDNAGRFAFLVTEEGLYEVSRNPGDCIPTTPLSRQVWIVRRPDGSLSSFEHANFGCRGDSVPGDSLIVTGIVFLDGNRNGQPDRGEAGVPGVRVRGGSDCLVLCPPDSNVVASAVTDAEGRYVLRDPAACCRLGFVEHDPVPGHIDTSPNPVRFGGLGNTPLPPPRPDPTGREFLLVNFGVAPDSGDQIHVTGTVYEDANRNGQRDRTEPGLPGVLLVASVPACPTFAPIEARTDANGAFAISLPACPPPYLVHRESLAGFVDTTPNPVVFLHLPPPTEPRLVANFGVAPDDTPVEAFVEGVVFDDTNHNGSREMGEPGVAEVTIRATGERCLPPFLASTRTDSEGRYRIDAREVGCPWPWVVTMDPPDSNCATTPNPVIVRGPAPDGTVGRVDFGIAPCDLPPPDAVAVQGTVFADLNRNGVRDAGEHGIATVRLRMLSHCDALWTARTDLRGVYRFPRSQLGCPVNAVQVFEPEFPQFTTPNPAPVSLPPPGVVTTVDFGVVPRR